jgi:hypothetical protein
MGLTFKMYANESKGEKWPAVAYYWVLDPNTPLGTHPNAGATSQGRYQINFAPRIRDIYPEYMPDPLILVCPSDSSNGLRDAAESSCINTSSYLACPGSGVSAEAGHPNPDISPGDEIGIHGVAGSSYSYLGYVFDKLEITQNLSQLVAPETAGSLPIGTILNTFITAAGGTALDWSTVPASTQPAQVFEYIWNELLSVCSAIPTINAARVECGNRVADVDRGPIVVPPGAPSPLVPGDPFGTGTGDTIYRFREGIERFMIT